MSFYFACRQLLIVNFQILMHFHAFVPLSSMPSSGILAVLPAPRNCCSFILHSFLIYNGLSLCSEKGVFLGQKGRGQQNFPGLHPQTPILLSHPGAITPEIFLLDSPLLTDPNRGDATKETGETCPHSSLLTKINFLIRPNWMRKSLSSLSLFILVKN